MSKKTRPALLLLFLLLSACRSARPPEPIPAPRVLHKAAEHAVTLEELRRMEIMWDTPFPDCGADIPRLFQQNGNCVGFLSFHFDPPGTDYDISLAEPVAFETEPDFYLKHGFSGNPDKNGCVFLDYQSNPTLYGYNDFLYAHHASDKSLFGTLERIYMFDGLPWLQSHPQYLYLYTKTACHKYVLAAYERVEDSNNHYAYTTCENEGMYLEYADYIRHLPSYIPSPEIQWDTKPGVLNFSTCDGEPGTPRRFVVHFVKLASYAYKMPEG